MFSNFEIVEILEQFADYKYSLEGRGTDYAFKVAKPLGLLRFVLMEIVQTRGREE